MEIDLRIERGKGKEVGEKWKQTYHHTNESTTHYSSKPKEKRWKKWQIENLSEERWTED